MHVKRKDSVSTFQLKDRLDTYLLAIYELTHDDWLSSLQRVISSRVV
jgi:hypothetical protein